MHHQQHQHQIGLGVRGIIEKIAIYMVEGDNVIEQFVIKENNNVIIRSIHIYQQQQ